MKIKLTYIKFCSVILLISACSTIEVHDNYDTSYDFTKLKTYNWISVHDKKHALAVKQLRGELTIQLAAKGFRHNAANPDFLIALHGGTEDKVIIRSGNYGYQYGTWHGGYYAPGRTEVYEYKEGTLVLDIIDAKSKEVVFQSTTTKEVVRGISMEKRQENIKKVIAKAIESFPPGMKKK